MWITLLYLVDKLWKTFYLFVENFKKTCGKVDMCCGKLYLLLWKSG